MEELGLFSIEPRPLSSPPKTEYRRIGLRPRKWNGCGWWECVIASHHFTNYIRIMATDNKTSYAPDATDELQLEDLEDVAGGTPVDPAVAAQMAQAAHAAVVAATRPFDEIAN